MVSYFKNIISAIWTVILGMKVTAIELFKPSVTLQYPEEKLYPEKRKKGTSVPILFDWEPPERYRGDLFCKIEDCIGCMMCDQICPVDCFDIVTERASPGEDIGKTSSGQVKRLKILKFDIDMTKCVYCGMCAEPCPTECLVMTKEYEFSSYSRKELVHHFARPEIYKKKPPQGPGTEGIP